MERQPRNSGDRAFDPSDDARRVTPDDAALAWQKAGGEDRDQRLVPSPRPRPWPAGDDHDDEPEEERRRIVGRRGLVAALLGGGVGAAAIGTVLSVEAGVPAAAVRPQHTETDLHRPAAAIPRAGGTFADRDDSYSQASGPRPPLPEAQHTERVQFSGPAEAAAKTKVTVPTILDTAHPEVHLLRRVTFGPTPGTVADVRAKGIDAWLAEQLNPSSIPDPVGDRVWRAFPNASMTTSQIRSSIKQYSWDAMFGYAQATLGRQVWSSRQVQEVMVDFWANHLNMPMPSDGAWDVGVSYHNDVIRKNALGSFETMLKAAGRHPAMLRFLSNDQSRKESVNENLGRELIELHTVGIDAGYSETDVRNSAYILTGRTVAEDGSFRYDPDRHWTGKVKVLGFADANASASGGLAVGDRYLKYLAHHPSTAKMIARKLCVRFVADKPPAALVERLTKAYLESGTKIVPVLHTLLSSPEFWAAVGQKVRRPLENMVAGVRVLGVRPGADIPKGVNGLYWSLDQAGHRPLAWAPPNGYPDVAAAWASSGAMLQMWNSHRGLVQGWWEGLDFVEPAKLAPASSASSYVDALAQRLVHQRLGATHRKALVDFLGTHRVSDYAPHLAPLLLDSPYFALR
jgi:uncharacterized protein (DUF1800 family)